MSKSTTSTQEQDQGLQSSTSNDVRLRDVSNWVDGLINACINMRPSEVLSGAPLTLWDAGGSQLADRGTVETHTAQVLMLDALIASPEGTQALLQRLRGALVDADPQLAHVATPHLAPAQTAPLAIVHRINDNDFRLEPDGTLTCFMVQDLAPAEVFDLLTFFRMPGVAAVIERAEAERQTATEQEWQADQREEMTRDQALALLQTDDDLMRRLVSITTERALALIKEDKAA